MTKSLGNRIATISAISAALFALAFIGMSSATAAEKPPAVGKDAKDFELNALGDGKVKLSKLTDAGPVVLVVLRGYPGYQCPLCTLQVGEFLGKADELKDAGAQVVFVYPGPAEELKAHAEEFVQGKDYPDHFHLLLDPDYKFTNLYGLRWDAPNETAYPSTFVIDGKRKVKLAKISKGHGDRSKVADVLKAIPAE